MDVELLEARWRMGRILTSDLRGIGAELAAAGQGAGAVAALAEGRSDARETFELVLAELGGGSMTDERAALVLARRFARLLLDGESPPDLTVKAIAGLRWRGGSGVDDALAPFAALHERYERAKLAGPLARLTGPLLDRRARGLAEALAAGA